MRKKMGSSFDATGERKAGGPLPVGRCPHGQYRGGGKQSISEEKEGTERLKSTWRQSATVHTWKIGKIRQGEKSEDGE